jgi:hypothetical protein
MSNTTTEPTSFVGIHDGYTAHDDNGHAGYGSTKEAANEALQHSQEHDLAKSEHSLLGGWWEKEK